MADDCQCQAEQPPIRRLSRLRSVPTSNKYPNFPIRIKSRQAGAVQILRPLSPSSASQAEPRALPVPSRRERPIP
ncbi:hypothetical protein FOBRF1_001208 [Fusarium oxysporum]